MPRPAIDPPMRYILTVCGDCWAVAQRPEFLSGEVRMLATLEIRRIEPMPPMFCWVEVHDVDCPRVKEIQDAEAPSDTVT